MTARALRHGYRLVAPLVPPIFPLLLSKHFGQLVEVSGTLIPASLHVAEVELILLERRETAEGMISGGAGRNAIRPGRLESGTLEG